MDKNRDLRRTAISTVNGLPRRRQRVTTLSDLTDGDRQMEIKETVRLRDRVQLQKDRDRDFPKRRKVDNRSAVQQRSGGSGGNYREYESTGSSDEEYFEEEEETRSHQQSRMNQLSPASSSPSSNRRGLRTLRWTPVLRAAADEVLGVPIPRRARSASAKKFHEYRNSASGRFREDLSYRKFPPSPAGFGGASPSFFGVSTKKKMKYVDPRTRGLSSASNLKPSSVIQDDIEIEVAEALFDLMKQSHSQSQSSEREEKVDRDGTNNDDIDDLKRLKAEPDKDENDGFIVRNEQSTEVNAETILTDSMKELNKGGRIQKEKFPDDPAQELVSGDGFVDKGKVWSPKESESPSCVIQDLTVTKADYAASMVEAKGSRIEIDLMALPSLPSSPERDGIDPKATTQDVQKKSDTTTKYGIQIPEEKVGVISDKQLLNLNPEKHRHDISSVCGSTTQQEEGWNEPKNQSPTSLLPFSTGMGSWPGVFPHPRSMWSHRAALPIDGNARSSIIMQPPQFKFSQPRRKRCTTHQYIAHNIHNHQQLIEKSLSSGPAGGAATLYGAKPLDFKSMLPTERFISGNLFLGDFGGGQNLATLPAGGGKDKSSEFKVTASGNSLLQQASNQAQARNFLHNPGFTFALGCHQTTMMAPPNSSGPPQSASAISNLPSPSNNLSRKPSAKNSSLLDTSTTAVGFNNHPIFPSNDAAASYMAILQSSGCPFPMPTNIPLPSFKGGSSSMPLNSTFYSPPVFNIAQNQHMSSLPHAIKIGDNKLPAPEKVGLSVGDGSVKPNNNAPTYSFPVGNNNKHGDISQQGSKSRAELVPQSFPLSFSSNVSSPTNVSSMSQNPAIFQNLPEMPWNGNKNLPTSQEKSQTRGGQSRTFPKSDCAHASSSAVKPSKLGNISQSANFHPPSLNSIAIPNFYHQQHQMQQFRGPATQTDNPSFLPKWDHFPRATAPEESSQSLVNIPQLKISQAHQNRTSYSNNPGPIQGHHHVVTNSEPVVSSLTVGSSSNSSISKNTSGSQRNGPVVGIGASTVSVLASQETEGSQKSTPACRRNVPSILSTCAS